MWSLRSRNGCVSLNLCKAFCSTLPVEFPLEAWWLPFRPAGLPGAHGRASPKAFLQSLLLPISFSKCRVQMSRETAGTQAVPWKPERLCIYLHVYMVGWLGQHFIETAAAFSFNMMFEASFFSQHWVLSHESVPHHLGHHSSEKEEPCLTFEGVNNPFRPLWHQA